MIILNSTDKIEVILGGNVTTRQLECFASYRDTTSTTIVAGCTASNTNNTTAINLVPSPSASVNRIIDYLSIYNADSVSSTVTVRFNVSGTPYILTSASLYPGEKLEYQEGIGFRSLTSAGALKQSNRLSYNNITGINSVVLTADRINNNVTANTIADITGLSFSVTSGKTYWFRFVIPFTSASNSTGSRFSINGAATSSLHYESQYSLTGSTMTINQGLGTYDSPASCNITSNLTGNIAIIEGVATFSASGTLIGRFASEVSNSAITARQGSVVFYKQLD
jgi:hypothetical protein